MDLGSDVPGYGYIGAKVNRAGEKGGHWTPSALKRKVGAYGAHRMYPTSRERLLWTSGYCAVTFSRSASRKSASPIARPARYRRLVRSVKRESGQPDRSDHERRPYRDVAEDPTRRSASPATKKMPAPGECARSAHRPSPPPPFAAEARRVAELVERADAPPRCPQWTKGGRGLAFPAVDLGLSAVS